MEGFQIEKGFQLDLIAEEPLVLDPVGIEFNERGDALVLEMPGYPFEDANSHLKVLFDTNHDGKMDASQVIHSNLGLASSFLPVDKGILVASPPYLLFLQDVNADYAIEKVDTLMGGFAKDNLQHNFNGLSYGMDGWIYAANGGNDGSPFWWGKPYTKIVLKGQDFRFHLTEKRLEKIGESSGGFGLAQDEYNRLYETHNLNKFEWTSGHVALSSFRPRGKWVGSDLSHWRARRSCESFGTGRIFFWILWHKLLWGRRLR